MLTTRALAVTGLALLLVVVAMLSVGRGRPSWRSGEDECPKGRKLDKRTGKCVCNYGWNDEAKKCKKKGDKDDKDDKDDKNESRTGRGLKAEGGDGWRRGVVTCFKDTQFAVAGNDSNMVAVHQDDWDAGFKNKTLEIKYGGRTFKAKVSDYCNRDHPDCKNRDTKGGGNFLLDVHMNTLRISENRCDNTKGFGQWRVVK